MDKFKVLLVYSNLQMLTLLPNNITCLSAYLKKAGIEVQVFNTTFYKTAEKSVEDIRVEYMQIRPFNLKEKGIDYNQTNIYEDFIKVVHEYKPDLIGISATDDTYELGIQLISKVKDRDMHVVVGGVYATFAPDEVINNPYVNSVCIGEGEEALLELCLKMQDKQDICGIKNLWVKLNGKIYKNGLRPVIDINKLPYEDFSIFEERMFFRAMHGKVYRMIPVASSRGCPYSCLFCAAPFQKKLYSYSRCGNYFRVKTVDRIMEELKYYVEKYKADYIYFNSETFFARSKEDIIKLAQEYSKTINLPFWCQTRIETLNEQILKILADMNCARINIGIEHGNEDFRKKILKRYYTNKQARDSFRLLEKSKIPFSINNMIGLPDETRELAFDTIKLNRAANADTVNVFNFVPYRGIPLRQYCIDKGYLDPCLKSDTVVRSSILKMPQFPPGQIKGLMRTFPLYVKMPESYFDKIKIAEQLNKEGDAVLAELRDIYFNKYFT